jgi:hypothetical protein
MRVISYSSYALVAAGVVAGALGLVLFLKNILFQKPTPPRLIDRLPTADFIGKVNVLDLARETSGMMYYHKIPFRDFTSYEFLLGQGKMFFTAARFSPSCLWLRQESLP